MFYQSYYVTHRNMWVFALYCHFPEFRWLCCWSNCAWSSTWFWTMIMGLRWVRQGHGVVKVGMEWGWWVVVYPACIYEQTLNVSLRLEYQNPVSPHITHFATWHLSFSTLPLLPPKDSASRTLKIKIYIYYPSIRPYFSPAFHWHALFRFEIHK